MTMFSIESLKSLQQLLAAEITDIIAIYHQKHSPERMAKTLSDTIVNTEL